MRLEDEIKQKKFKSEHHKLAVNIMYTSNWAIGEFQRVLKPFGLSPQQYNVLRILRGQKGKPASVNLIIDRMLDKNSNASRLVEKLRKKEYIERRECEHDRRQVDIVITKEGLKFLELMDKNLPQADKTYDVLSSKEAKTLNDLMDKLRG